ncbi:hypothetical protein [Gilvimarinus chinensis]|uniref:hypothetical protein n=1 Tax=Gilvimarinus chinensis TaxID=396005 RepID=UPI00035FB756|nr:hypothetical protein [Gilvimarinus chinensis]
MPLVNTLRLCAFSMTVCTFLSACQTQEIAPPTEADLHDYAVEVQRAAVSDLTVLQRCGSLGGDVAIKAVGARDNWTFSNSSLLKAAETLLAQQTSDIVHWQQQAYSLTSLALVKDESLRRAQRLNLAQRVPSDQKTTCERELQRIETTSYADIGKEQRLSQFLLASVTEQMDISDVSLISDQFSRWPEPGRTYFTLKQSVDTECTENSRIMALVNHWPEEAYAYFCGDKPISLIECQWGECTSQAVGPAN